MNTTNGANKRL